MAKTYEDLQQEVDNLRARVESLRIGNSILRARRDQLRKRHSEIDQADVTDDPTAVGRAASGFRAACVTGLPPIRLSPTWQHRE